MYAWFKKKKSNRIVIDTAVLNWMLANLMFKTIQSGCTIIFTTLLLEKLYHD
jgi:hypothetical protein